MERLLAEGGALRRFLEQDAELAIMLLDAQGRLTGHNQAFGRLVQRPGSQVGRALEEFFPAGFRLASPAGAGQPQRAILPFSSPDGEPTFVNAWIYPFGRGRVVFAEQPRQTSSQALDRMSAINNELVNLTRQLKRQQQELTRAQARIKVLGGLIPICANCHKIRNDQGYWDKLEKYISEHSEAVFSHGICPDCAASLYPELAGELEPD